MQPHILSTLYLRRFVGAVAMLLPVVLAGFGGLQPSLSAYYSTPLRDVFVLALGAIGVALLFYRAYDWRDTAAGTLAGLSVIVVALVPHDHPTNAPLHVAAALVFFVTLAYMAGVLFTLSAGFMTEQKLQRNAVYRASALVILLCLLLAGLGAPLFWVESAAVWAFGVAWLVKGEVVLRDVEAAP